MKIHCHMKEILNFRTILVILKDVRTIRVRKTLKFQGCGWNVAKTLLTKVLQEHGNMNTF